jgi:nanoRNase/pAp phosphatase (c-di-AMP/oligoRNAs hydrolase)
MTAFVESCLQTVAGSAIATERRSRGRPRARKLLKILADKKNILITAHVHPDPDALASCHALAALLQMKLKGAAITVSAKGRIGGGLNEAFTKVANLKIVPWDESTLDQYDAIVLLDTQPMFAYSPLPPNVAPTAVIDHHIARGRKPRCPFCDIRTDVGATSSIIFSYFMELEVQIPRDIAATLLYGIESDLAGAAGTPGNLDNMALSSLVLLADMHRLYQMRYVDLPQSYYVSYAEALATATFFDSAMIAHLEEVDSLEKPAVIADFLLRFDKVQWALVTGLHDGRMILSLRCSAKDRSAGDVMRALTRGIGQGGGHRAKAGGFIELEDSSPAKLEKLRTTLRRRLLRVLGISTTRGQKLVPERG